MKGTGNERSVGHESEPGGGQGDPPYPHTTPGRAVCAHCGNSGRALATLLTAATSVELRRAENKARAPQPSLLCGPTTIPNYHL